MKINRRSFLKNTLVAGTMLAGTGSLISACSGFGRSDLPDHSHPERLTSQLDEARIAVLYHASLAPSGHNSQPWYVRVKGRDEWIIGLDPTRRLPAVDPNNREALLSIGAFAENLAIAGRAFGLKSEMEVIAQDPVESDILRVTLKAAAPKDYMLERIKKRMTVKHGYLPGEIRKEDVDALGKPLMGRMFYFPTGTRHANCLLEGAIENFRIQAQRDDAQRELVQWVRISNRDAERYRDGLTLSLIHI